MAESKKLKRRREINDMEAKAQHRFARMSSRKLRPLRMVLRGLPVKEAMSQLQFMSGKASGIVRDVLKSAIANATHNYEANEEQLVVSDVIIEDAFSFKRFQPASRGTAHPIKKRTSHVTVLVEEIGGVKERTIGKKKTNIQDITVAEHWGGQEESSEDVENDEKKDKESTKVVSEKEKEKQVFEENKLQQKGGDRRTAHRQQGK